MNTRKQDLLSTPVEQSFTLCVVSWKERYTASQNFQVEMIMLSNHILKLASQLLTEFHLNYINENIVICYIPHSTTQEILYEYNRVFVS